MGLCLEGSTEGVICFGVDDRCRTDKLVWVLLSDLVAFWDVEVSAVEDEGEVLDTVGLTTLTEGIWPLGRPRLGLIMGDWGNLCLLERDAWPWLAGWVSMLTAGMVTGT